MVFIELPMIQNLRFDLDYWAKMLFYPLTGHMQLDVAQSTLGLEVNLKATKEGLLYP